METDSRTARQLEAAAPRRCELLVFALGTLLRGPRLLVEDYADAREMYAAYSSTRDTSVSPSAGYSGGAGSAVSGGPTATLGPDRGSSTVKVEPRPSSLCTEMVPPSASTMVRQT